jgi:hypothetical protein
MNHTLPNNWRRAALKLRDEFGMSPSQQLISNETLHRRLQIVWGPPVCTTCLGSHELGGGGYIMICLGSLTHARGCNTGVRKNAFPCSFCRVVSDVHC